MRSINHHDNHSQLNSVSVWPRIELTVTSFRSRHCAALFRFTGRECETESGRLIRTE